MNSYGFLMKNYQLYIIISLFEKNFENHFKVFNPFIGDGCGNYNLGRWPQTHIKLFRFPAAL